VTRLFLIRHAQAQGNVERFFQGRVNTEISEIGRKQLEYLSERFKNEKIDIMYSSPFKRALQTADAVNKYQGLEIIKDDRIVEINGGDFEGKYWDEIDRLYPEQSYMWKNRLDSFNAPNGEKMIEVYERMRMAVTDLVTRNIGKTVAVVSHGCAIRNFLCYVEFGDLSKLIDAGWADNTSVSLLEYDDENQKFKIIYKNDSTHLPDDINIPTSAIWSKGEK
jgi:broad specificity phosphatase PhoE